MSRNRDVVVRVIQLYGDRGPEIFAGTAAEVRAQLIARFGVLRRRNYRCHDLAELVAAIDRCQAYAAVIGSEHGSVTLEVA